MFKLLRFLKPYIFPLITAIFLLYIQAQTDLTLPDYMSDIVNKGIQQNGIVNTVPVVINKSNFEKISLLLNKDETKILSDSFELVAINDSKFNTYKEEYPMLNEDIFILKNISNEKLLEIDKLTSKALISLSAIEQMDKGNKELKFNGQVLLAKDIFGILKTMDMNSRLTLVSNLSEKTTLLDKNDKNGIAIKKVKDIYVSLGKNIEKLQNAYIIKIGGKMLLISLLGAVCSITVVFIAAKIAAGLATTLRRDIFSKVESFSNNEFDKFSTATLITRSTNDVTQILTLMVVMIRMLFYAPLIGVGGIIKALERSNSMSYIIILSVLILIGIIAIIFSIALPKFKIVQKKVDRINLILRENLQGMNVIRAFNTQKFEEERFDKANSELTNINIFVNQMMVVLFPAMMLIMNGATLAITWVGAHEIANSTMQVGDMMAFMQYAIQIIFSFLMLSFMFILVPRASVSAERIAEVLDTEASIVDPKVPKALIPDNKGEIEFKNVSFRYHGAEEDALKNISFVAESGKTTAIIGSTGSGKTTLINLIPRFYDATQGEILVNGVNVKELNQHSLRSLIGYIPQNASLFTGTIESNLKYADENADLELITKALRVSQSSEFVEEKGLETEVSQGGNNLSGGQKQRLSIARALVKNPDIYIFDDSFSALDFKTDSKLRKALREEVNESTLIIVAQRISTIKNSDKILVLNDGKIVGIGTHRELLNSCETYKEIALSQLSQEELA